MEPSEGAQRVTWPRRIRLFLVGERPVAILAVFLPTMMAVALDLVLRPAALWHFGPAMKGAYLGSGLAGAFFTGGLLWLASRLALVRGGWQRVVARAALGLLFVFLLVPFSFFSYGAQVMHRSVFATYISRDSVRLGLQMRQTVGQWFVEWGSGSAAGLVAGVAIAVLIAYVVRRAAPALATASPVLPLLFVASSSYCFWIDFVETRALQAAPPDACFIHGAIYAFRTAVIPSALPRRGVALRIPDAIPPLTRPAKPRNVVVVLTESVRADAMCSARDAGCEAPFLNEVAPERIPLGTLTSQSSGTFTSCMMLWTGLGPDTEFETAHRAPFLWEMARAVGYRTAYIASQNLVFNDLGVYLQRSGIDVRKGAAELGGAADWNLGADDERATAEALTFVRGVPAGTPYFLLVHLSNTHWPYRVDAELQPYSPHANKPGRDPQATVAYHNHYLNAVRLQERTVAAFVREMRATPGWEDTALVFTSDHGEAFREHGTLHHLVTLYDEEVRVPGWIVAGGRGLSDAERAGIKTHQGHRTYSQDMNATIRDLLGVFDESAKLAVAKQLTGRSLLRERPRREPIVFMSTRSAVWEGANPAYGVRHGERMTMATETRPFRCFDGANDPALREAIDASKCRKLIELGEAHFPAAKRGAVDDERD